MPAHIPPCAAAIAEITPPSILMNTPAPQPSSPARHHCQVLHGAQSPSTPIARSQLGNSIPAGTSSRSFRLAVKSSELGHSPPSPSLRTQTAAYCPAPAIIRSKPSTSLPFGLSPLRPAHLTRQGLSLVASDIICRLQMERGGEPQQPQQPGLKEEIPTSAHEAPWPLCHKGPFPPLLELCSS